MDWLYIVTNPDAKRMKYVMEVGRARTWPNISMICNRLRIESSINLARKSIKKPKADRNDRDPKRQNSVAAATSNDASGSGDEVRFLVAGRRASMPDGSNPEREWQKEEVRRRKFLAQFSDRRQVIGSEEIVAEEANGERYDDDSDDESSIWIILCTRFSKTSYPSNKFPPNDTQYTTMQMLLLYNIKEKKKWLRMIESISIGI